MREILNIHMFDYEDGDWTEIETRACFFFFVLHTNTVDSGLFQTQVYLYYELPSDFNS